MTKMSEPSNPARAGAPRRDRVAPAPIAPRSTSEPAPNRLLPRPWSRSTTPRRLKFTREGKFFVGITLGVGFAAINTGNNLLYLLLGMLLALIIVSGLMSELSLRGLTVVRRLPLRAQVGRPHLVEIEVFNHKSRVPSYAIEVEDLRANQPADKRCFFLKISPRSAQVAAYRRTPARRGRDRHVGFRIATRFPFGLFEKSREIPADGQLIIYPAVDPLQLPPLAPGRRDGAGTYLRRGHGDDYLGLKLLRDGEDPRDVHWRKSAALGQLVTRERAHEARPEILLTLDVVRHGETEGWSDVFEKTIRDVASRAVAHIKRGETVTIHTTAAETVRGDRAIGADRLLRFLALVEPMTTEEDVAAPSPPAPRPPAGPAGAIAERSPSPRPDTGGDVHPPRPPIPRDAENRP